MSEIEVEAIIEKDTETVQDIKEPEKYQVIFVNDNFTPMEFVVEALMAIFHHTKAASEKIMIDIHEKGKGIAGGPYSREIADTKAINVIDFFKQQGYPLLAKTEKI